MPIRYTDASMAPALREIWRDAFPEDTPEDVDFFLSRLWKPNRCLVCVEGDTPVSMVFLLPAQLELSGAATQSGKAQTLRLRYVYAAATRTAFRGRGLFGSLLTEAHQRMCADGVDAAFLHPADSSLFGYYARFGYRPFFYAATERRMAADREGVSDGDEIKQTADGGSLRTTLLADHPAWVRWPDETLSYAAERARRWGGGLLTDSGGLALCEPYPDFLRVPEYLCPPALDTAFLRKIAERFGVDEIETTRPLIAGEHPTGHAFGMLCPLTERMESQWDRVNNVFPYMGMALD